MTINGQQLDIQKESVCLSVKLGMAGKRRKISAGQIETDADRTMVHVSKDIFESKELQAIGQHRQQIRAYLRDSCLPSPFRAGVYLVRTKMLQTVMHKLEQFEAEDRELIEAFMLFYERIYNERHNENSELRERLGSLYDPSDYPSPKKLRTTFSFETQIWELSTPGSLRSIDRALYEKEVEKMQNVWESARQQITQVMLQEFRDMTARMAERLTPNPDGTKKVFRDSLVGNLQEWLDIFDKRALTDDADLVGLVKRARQFISGIEPETIRDSEALKAEVAKEMQEITAHLDQAIIDKPARKIDLED